MQASNRSRENGAGWISRVRELIIGSGSTRLRLDINRVTKDEVNNRSLSARVGCGIHPPGALLSRSICHDAQTQSFVYDKDAWPNDRTHEYQ